MSPARPHRSTWCSRAHRARRGALRRHDRGEPGAARARLGLENAETQLAAAIAADLHARPDDLTPRVVAAVVIALERVLLGVLRTHLLRGSTAAVTKRALRRDCDRAFAIVDAGITAYGARPRVS